MDFLDQFSKEKISKFLEPFFIIFWSDISNEGALVEAANVERLSTESSNASVLLNLNEAIEQLQDQSQYTAGRWRPFFIPEFMRDVVVGREMAVKRKGSQLGCPRSSKVPRVDSEYLDLGLCDALDALKEVIIKADLVLRK